jgi:multicomponent Na+:H+ antiporter subunit D
MTPGLLLLLPFFAAFPVFAAVWVSPRFSRALAMAAAVAGFLAALGAGAQSLSAGVWPSEMGGWAAPWGVEIRLSPFACFWTALLYLSTVLKLLTDKPASSSSDYFDAALLLLTGSLAALALDKDLFDFYLWVELALVAGGLLIVREGPGYLWMAFRFVFWGSVGASFLLLGLIYLYSGTSTLDLDDLLSQLLIDKNEDLIGFGGFFVTLGLALPLMFPGSRLFAPFLSRLSPGLMAFLGPLLARAAALLLFEIYFSGLGAPGFQPPLWLKALEQIAAVFFLADFWFARRQKNWEPVTGFLSAASLGYLLAGFILGSTPALQGALLELVSQVLALTGLFYLSVWLKEAAGTDELARFSGAARRAPWTAAAFLLLGLNLVGLPPFGGFYGKYYLFEAALQQRQWFLSLALLGAYGFSLFYLGKAAWKLFTREEGDPQAVSIKKAPKRVTAVLWVLALAGLALGFWHKTLLRDIITPALPKAFQHWTPPVENWNSQDVE